MSVTLYFSKVNINSHIYPVYEDKIQLKDILRSLYLSVKDDVEFVKEAVKITENGETFLSDAYYKFSFIEKLDNDFRDKIFGSVVKTAKLFINDIDEKTKKIKKIPIENKEIIDFYFDVNKEIVVFHTTNRFGYQEFNMAFKELINKCMSEPEEQYNFEVTLLREGLNVEDIKSQLKSIGKLELLKVDIIPPNVDEELLNDIKKNGEAYIEGIKQANITQTSILFTSSAPEGLNIDSKVIAEQLERADSIHSGLSSQEATKIGYINIEARNKEGRYFSTDKNKPIKNSLDEKPENVIDFAKACKRKLETLFTTFF